MTPEMIMRRDELFDKLTVAFKETPLDVRPWSPVKWERGDGKDIILCYPNKHKIVGCCPQVENNEFKIWFHEHPEWELETKYPIKRYANNGSPGSGDGYYVESVKECISEFTAFFKAKYPELAKNLS